MWFWKDALLALFKNTPRAWRRVWVSAIATLSASRKTSAISVLDTSNSYLLLLDCRSLTGCWFSSLVYSNFCLSQWLWLWQQHTRITPTIGLLRTKVPTQSWSGPTKMRRLQWNFARFRNRYRHVKLDNKCGELHEICADLNLESRKNCTFADLHVWASK